MGRATISQNLASGVHDFFLRLEQGFDRVQ